METGRYTPIGDSGELRNNRMRTFRIEFIEQPLSVLGLGTATQAFSPARYDRAAALLDAFLAAGGTTVDTAAIYGFGRGEETLGRWLRATGRRREIVLITKGCHPAVDPADVLGQPWISRLTPEVIHADLNGSLERLGTDFIDLYLLHRDDEAVPVGPLVEALNREQAAGRIRAFGASNWRVERIDEANRYAAAQGLNGFIVSSPAFSLLRPAHMVFPGTRFADEPALAWHRIHQFPLLAWSALAAGMIGGRYDPEHLPAGDVARSYVSPDNFVRLRRARELAARKNATPLQIGLGYVLAQPFPIAALIGPSSVAHLAECLAAGDLHLTAEEVDFLDRPT